MTAPTDPTRIGAHAPTAQIRALAALTRYLSHDFLGGPRLLRMSWVINFQKLGTAPFVAMLMLAYGNTTAAAWVYLALHGSYGVCWVIKDVAFPDRRWQVRVTFGGAALTFALVLGLYWVAPWLLISGVLRPDHGEPTAALLAGAIALHTVGLAVMIGADGQKHFTLRARPGLITDGLFARTRHPNYLGEMMIYASYALIVRHWIPWAILAWVWAMVFYPNMRLVEASIARYPGFAAWRRRTGMVLPSVLRAMRRAKGEG